MSINRDPLLDRQTSDRTSDIRFFKLQQLRQQLNTLDYHNYGEWPGMIKIIFWILLFLMLLGLGYFMVIQAKIQEIDQAFTLQTTLLHEFKHKDSQLRNLKQYQLQLITMQENFAQQLQALPKETEIPALIEDIHITGRQAGLKLKNIVLEPEVQHEFLIEQPISIIATGDYHAFGRFVSTLAQLSRIVTLHDFMITAVKHPDRPTDMPSITYHMNSKTYRYIDTSEIKKEHE
ncbi:MULTISPECIES: type 4a pilus biogenesis protein PilO [unclassified Acinetobacter]|uniref:type 4a pilus biogenesis protein PilO n=1 Tax=unclassified Acinetobacter TaxID=196816 RepID=UPI002934BCD9|nr:MULTISPECIES: type 4a pilus biogenesis protein PilO [unclassified Acinetobacter]WOE31067.1 type 4a pilus biogenesis protein PilO [Acinetobacter sp. SAAs470]WOE39263.1 type 4a pilus biogenesis protein PilO [Acinetobacter sp. SAAs474]